MQHSGNGSSLDAPLLQTAPPPEREILHEKAFRKMLCLERKRTERSQKPFLLMLLETGERQKSDKTEKLLSTVLSAMLASTRATDTVGWYNDHSSAGVMFTELAIDDKNSILSTMLSRVSSILQDKLNFEQFNQISISFHFFPDMWDADGPERPSNPTLYPDLMKTSERTKLSSVIKRTTDIVVGTLLLATFCPVLLIIALTVKVSSKGPVLFRQRRVGQYGKPFVFLKFRSMYVDNDPGVHREYVTQLIAGQAASNPAKGNGNGVYKLTHDSRVTRVGVFLRRTSLDELPQILNVLSGEMSLVGPRPALPYEVTAYQTWHRRRVLAVKPGITGLWQVSGRCRLKFDEAVRLDLRYAENWSPWLDIKILLRTPRAVWSGEGAY